MEERLRKFAKVVDNGSYTRAAAELHISQPALTATLHKLERELGATLIVRGKQPLTLTEAGKEAHAYAKELTTLDSNFRLRLAALAGENPQVHIGLIDSLADALLVAGDQLPALEKQARVALSVNNSRYLLQALQRDNLDVVLIVAPARPLPTALRSIPLGSEPLVGVTSPERLQAVNRAIKNGALPGFLGYDQPSYTNQLIRQHFSRRGIELQTIFHSTSPEIILHMVLTGRGSAVLPYTLVAEHVRQGRLQPFAARVARPIIAVHCGRKTLPSSLTTLVQSARTALAAQNTHVKTMGNATEPQRKAAK
jgi:DNA-binding transcriptional LysR family regulator